MSATPIPRSLAMTLYGDLDLCVLDEMPPGRTPIRTRALGEKDRLAAYRQVRVEIEAGRQAYVVAPLVEETETSDLRAAEALRTELATGPLLGLSLGLLHGRMKPEQKTEVMDRFRRGLIQVLVATTVVEVGVDVPNATIMLVEHADRFGLSQLHQLRGRVGLGEHASHCLLFNGRGVSNHGFPRLKVMEETTDGFVLAEKDLEIRGPGDLLGTRQAGVPALRLANLVRDRELLYLSRDWAQKVLNGEVAMTQPERRTLWAAIKAAWKGTGALLSSG